MVQYEEQVIRDLIDGKLGWQKLKAIMSSYKDADRFDKYLKILQEKVTWKDQILIPYGIHLYIVEKTDKRRVVKCDCGQEFGDYKKNWKLSALIYVRNDLESLVEIYPELMACDPEWMELREFYCPRCKALLDVEAVPPGYPITFDFQPDLDGLYKTWLQKDLRKD